MANVYKVLGQVAPAATSLTTLYTATAPSVASTIAVCNRSASSGTYRVAVRPGAAAIDNKHYLAYDTALPGNSTDCITIGLTVAAGDVVSVYASSGDLSFSLFGSEVS